MSSMRVVAFRPAARVGVVASSLALLAMLFSPNPALAATTLGTTGDVIDVVCSFPSMDSVQLSSADPTVTYTVPAAGNITDWNTQSLGLPGLVGLQVWRLVTPATVTNPAVYMLVGASPTVVPNGTAITLTTPIAVQAGDMIGMRMEGVVACGHRTNAAQDIWVNTPGTIPALPVLGTESFSAPANSFRLNISATVGAVTPPPPPPPPPTCGDSSGSSNENDECDQNNNEDQTDTEKADNESDHNTKPTPDEASSARTDERKDS